MAVNGYELDWDSTIENDEQQYTLLDEGDYSFVVDHNDRTYVGSESEKYAVKAGSWSFFCRRAA